MAYLVTPGSHPVVADVSRRGLLVGGAALAALVGCGQGADDPGTGADDGYPRSVRHAEGEVVIPSRPQRVLSEFNGYEFDALLALGVPLVGRGEASGNELFPWQVEAGGAEIPVLPFYGANVEEFAKAEPDVLFMVDLNYEPGGGDVVAYEQVAPVVSIPGDLEPALRVVGDVMGVEVAQVDRLVAESEALLDGFEPPSRPESVVAFYYYGDGSLYLATDQSPLSQLLQRVGLPALSSPPGDDGSAGTATVSVERADLLEADLLIGLLDGDCAGELDALEREPVFAGLDVVRRGRFVRLGTDDGRAMSRPTALLLPYALEALRRLLSAAAAGRRSVEA